MHDMKSTYNIHYLCFNPVAIEEIVSYFHEGDYVYGGAFEHRRYWMMCRPKLAMMNDDYIYKLNQ